MSSNHDVLSALIEVMSDASWQMIEIVKPEFKDDKEKAIVNGTEFDLQPSDHEQQTVFDHEYIWQQDDEGMCGGCYGEILFPIEDDEYILVRYSM